MQRVRGPKIRFDRRTIRRLIPPILFVMLIVSSFGLYVVPFGQGSALLILTSAVLCVTLGNLHKKKHNLLAAIGYYLLSFIFIRNTIARAIIDNIGVFRYEPEEADKVRLFIQTGEFAFVFALISAIGLFLIFLQKYQESQDSDTI